MSPRITLLRNLAAMKLIRVVAILLSSLSYSLAAPAKPASPKPPSPDIAQWESVLAARERRVSLLRDEMAAIDSHIETRGDALIASLRSIADSNDSRSKVARMKEGTIEGIRRNIEYYQSKRAAIKEELRRPTLNLTDEEKETMIAALGGRIEKRIGQILDLLKSMPTHKEYQRYKVTGSNWAGPTYALNEDYVQDKRLVTITKRLQGEIESDLRASIARLEKENESMRAQYRASNYSSARDLSGQMAKNEALIEERRAQIAVVRSFVTTPTRKVSQKEAIDFDHERNNTATALRRDFEYLFALYNNLIPELSSINDTRAAIAAAKRGVPASGPSQSQ
jgi:hypothetical protein